MLGFRERGGRIIICPVHSNSARALEADILFAVEKEAFIFTDEHRGYLNLNEWSEHETVHHKRGEWVRDNVTTNSIESVWAILKRAHKGIYSCDSLQIMNHFINKAGLYDNLCQNILKQQHFRD